MLLELGTGSGGGSFWHGNNVKLKSNSEDFELEIRFDSPKGQIAQSIINFIVISLCLPNTHDAGVVNFSLHLLCGSWPNHGLRRVFIG